MPRKAAATTADGAPETSTEPRRSTRIKDQPKPESVKKAAPKPRAKKTAEGAADDKAEKPKAGRGKKRKEVEEPEAAVDAEEGEGAEEPPAKKVRFRFVLSTRFAYESF
jgi:hypothetical protein